MKKLFILLTFLFALFYRPKGIKVWSLWGTYDTRREAQDATFDEVGFVGGNYEFKIVPMLPVMTL